MYQDVHPRDALHSTSTAFTVCLDHMMGLLSDPLSSTGLGRKVSLVLTPTDGVERASSGAPANLGGVEGDVLNGGDDLGTRGGGMAVPGGGQDAGASGGDVVGKGSSGDAAGDVAVVDAVDDAKKKAALDKALLLLEDADMMRRMLEKLLEFDEKKYTAMFQVRACVCVC